MAVSIFARVLKKAKVIYVIRCSGMIWFPVSHMIPAHSVEEAIAKADEI